jgi:FAD synthetase
MTLEKLVSKYISSAEYAVNTMKTNYTGVSFDRNNIEKIIESAKAYLNDAKYYRSERKLDVSLTSVAYCEGLLDALKLLGAVTFEWPMKKRV